MAYYDEREIKAIRWLAAKYESGDTHIYNDLAKEFAEYIGLNAPDLSSHKPFIVFWQRLNELGAIDHNQGGANLFVGGITSPRILDMARSIDARRRQQTEQAAQIAIELERNRPTIAQRLQKHPVIGTVVILGGILVVLANIAGGIQAVLGIYDRIYSTSSSHSHDQNTAPDVESTDSLDN